MAGYKLLSPSNSQQALPTNGPLPSLEPSSTRRRSGSIAAAASIITSTKTFNKSSIGIARVVLHVDEAPSWTHIPFISGGYRVDHSILDAVISLFASHQDTLNIWSHALGCAWFLRMIPLCYEKLERNEAPTLDYFLFAVFLIGATTQMFTSALYHALRCVGPKWEAALLRADIVGILSMIGGSWVLAMGQGFHCAPLVGSAYTVIEAALLLSSHFLGAAAVTKPHLYPYYYAVIASSVGFGAIPCTHAMLTCTTSACTASLVQAHLGMFGYYFIGFVFFISRFPERALPRSFDIVGSSHTIWHIFVFLAGRAWLLGMLDYNSFKASQGHSRMCEV